MPVPDLEQTMGKYLDNLKPILTENEFEKTRLLVQDFADPDGPGPKVQRQLLQRREEMDNWVKYNKINYYDLHIYIYICKI